jgi:hypothetical protein
MGQQGEWLWDAEYKGPRFRYGLTYRPATYANVPDNYILWSGKLYPGYAHGTIDYPFRLSDMQVERFELTLVAELPGEA